MKVSSHTHPGRRRKNNEDCILVDGLRDIYIVADGIGGHKAGEMASRMACEVALDFLSTHVKREATDADIVLQMGVAFQSVHEIVKMSTQNNPLMYGMGTTLVLAVLRNGKAHIGHVGDSRAYLIRDEIRQLTNDHTWANYLLDVEKRSPDEIKPRMHHVLKQAIGVTETIAPDIQTLDLEEGDILLMCTDGLTDMLTDAQIYTVVSRHREERFNDLADLLVKGANKKGGRDNVSMVLVQYEESQDPFLRTTFSF